MAPDVTGIDAGSEPRTDGGSLSSASSRSDMPSESSGASIPMRQGEGVVKSVSIRSDTSESLDRDAFRAWARHTSRESPSRGNEHVEVSLRAGFGALDFLNDGAGFIENGVRCGDRVIG